MEGNDLQSITDNCQLTFKFMSIKSENCYKWLRNVGVFVENVFS